MGKMFVSRTRSTTKRCRTSLTHKAVRPGLEPLDGRILLTGGWAAALGTGGTSGHGVALDPSSASVYVSGTSLAKYTTGGQLLWSRNLGSSSTAGWNVAVDSSGDAYVSGLFTGTLSLGSQTLTSAGAGDGYVAKFDPSGNVLWARSFGGIGADQAAGLAVDSAGAAYVTGRFSNTVAFDAAHTLTSAGDIDIFVLKLDASGNVVYATQAGGGGHDTGIDIAVDGGGRAYVTGYFAGTSGFGATTLTSPGVYAAYIAQLDPSGNFTWARSMGSPTVTDQSRAQAQGVAIDGNGHVFATGTFAGTTPFGDATDGAGATSLTAQGLSDAFVTSLDVTNGQFLWTKQIGGASSRSYGYGLALDASGNVYSIGEFDGQNLGINADPGSGNALLTSKTGSSFQGYVSKLSPTGSFLGAWQIGTSGNSVTFPSGISVSADGSIYTVGTFYYATRFDTGTQYATLTSPQGDGFVSRMTPGQSVLFGQVFSDSNRNGVKDVGESPLAGVTVYIDANHNGKLDRGELSTTTNSLGGFSFYHLAAGTYTLREVVPSGYSLTTPAAVNVTLTTGQFNDGTVFGNYQPLTGAAIRIKSVPTITGLSIPAAPSILTVAGLRSDQGVNVSSKVTNGRRLPLTTPQTPVSHQGPSLPATELIRPGTKRRWTSPRG